jgi:hypothetical protein
MSEQTPDVGQNEPVQPPKRRYTMVPTHPCRFLGTGHPVLLDIEKHVNILDPDGATLATGVDANEALILITHLNRD